MVLELHECARFTRVIGDCPFRRFKEDDDSEEEKIPVRFPTFFEREAEERRTEPAFVPAARRQDRDRRQRGDPGQGQEISVPVIAHGQPAMKKALERMLPIQELGGFRSLPPLLQIMPEIANLLTKQDQRVESLRLSDSAPRQLMGILMAIAVGALLRRSPGRGFNPSFATVQAVEKRAAQESKQGEGQFMRKLFGLGGLASSENFSETGFF